MAKHQYKLVELADILGAVCIGDPDIIITGLATLVSARPGQLSFLVSSQYLMALQSTTAAAVIVSEPHQVDCPVACLVVKNPYMAYAKASQLFAHSSGIAMGIHPSAVVSASAKVDSSACIGANVTIEDDVVIAANTVISSGCVVGQGSRLGKDCLLHANVTLYHDTQIADRVKIHSTTVIGSDGFGYAPSEDRELGGWVKIAQLGCVRIGNDVEIGAGCTIDRGALDDTVLADRVILDNQVHLAHNVEVGENTAIAGCVGIAGSTQIGRNCTIAGGAGIVGHVRVVDNVHITGMAMITKSIDEPGSYSSGTGMQKSKDWRKSVVRFSQLDAISRRLRQVEKKLDG